MGECCSHDQRPVLRVTLKRGDDIPPEDDNGESDAYVIFRYGDLDRNRFETKKSKVITTKGGHCTWNEIIEFPFGGLDSNQNLGLQLNDRDLLKEDDVSGRSCIYYGKHPRNPKNTVSGEVREGKNKNQEIKYFLPLEWNIEESYVINIKDENGSEAGKIHLSIALDNRMGKIITEEERGLLTKGDD